MEPVENLTAAVERGFLPLLSSGSRVISLACTGTLIQTVYPAVFAVCLRCRAAMPGSWFDQPSYR